MDFFLFVLDSFFALLSWNMSLFLSHPSHSFTSFPMSYDLSIFVTLVLLFASCLERPDIFSLPCYIVYIFKFIQVVGDVIFIIPYLNDIELRFLFYLFQMGSFFIIIHCLETFL